MFNCKFFIAIGILVSSITFVSCGDDDIVGIWDPIQTTVNGEYCKSGVFKVPAEGGVYNISSNNYGTPRLNGISENDKSVDCSSLFSDTTLTLVKEWYKVNCHKEFSVTIAAKENGTPSRKLELEIQCGDAYGSLTLLQE